MVRVSSSDSWSRGGSSSSRDSGGSAASTVVRSLRWMSASWSRGSWSSAISPSGLSGGWLIVPTDPQQRGRGDRAYQLMPPELSGEPGQDLVDLLDANE